MDMQRFAAGACGGAPKRGQNNQTRATRSQKEPKGNPNGAKESQKRAQMEPKRNKRVAKGSHKVRKGSHKASKMHPKVRLGARVDSGSGKGGQPSKIWIILGVIL